MRDPTRFTVVVLSIVVIAGAVTGSAEPVRAQGSSAAAGRVDGARSGFTVGLSIGRGSISVDCAECKNLDPLTEALSLTAHLGYMITSRIAIGVEHWTVRYNDRGSEWFDDSADHLVAQRITTLSGQLWLGNRLWLKVGAGLGKHISDSHYARVQHDPAYANAVAKNTAALRQPVADPAAVYTPAVTGALGFEFARRTDLAIDVQFRVGTTRRPSNEYQVQNTGVVFGISWF